MIADDLNDWVGPLDGHPQVKTPALDALAGESFNFTNAHCQAPVCSPSRASLWTGLYPWTTGYYGNLQNDGNTWRKPPLLRNAVTMMQHFQRHGYAIWGAGKITHNSHHQWQLFWYQGDDQSGYGPEADFGPWPWDGKRKRAHPNSKPPFDFFMASIAPLSEVPSFPADPETGAPGYTGWRRQWNCSKPFHYESETDRSLMPDELYAEYAARKLSEPSDRPFFMAIGFMRPHVPLYAPKKFFDMYPPEDTALPPGFLENDLDDVAPADREPSRKWREVQEYWDGDEGFRREVAAYLACVSFVDAQVGKVMDALADGPHAGNTIVVFTSDHGYHNFEKKHLGKHTPWERSTRVPLFIHLPGQTESERISFPVELVDLFPTLNALCGLPNDPNAEGNGLALEGESLVPLLEDPRTPLHDFDAAISAARGVRVERLSELPLSTDEVKLTARSERYRYIRNHEGEEEFYDLRHDPHEWTNLINHPRYADEIARHRAYLIERVK